MSGNKDVSAFPDGDNLFRWAGTVRGGAGTPYEGMTFKLRMEFPADYPFKAPTIMFATTVRRAAASGRAGLRWLLRVMAQTPTPHLLRRRPQCYHPNVDLAT